MAKKPFQPTDNDKAFMERWLNRRVVKNSSQKGWRIEPSLSQIARDLGLNERWFHQRRASSVGFCQWWDRCAVRSIEGRVFDILDLCDKVFRESAESGKLDTRLAGLLLDKLYPIAKTIRVESAESHEPAEVRTREEVESDIVAYLDEKCRDERCSECGAPLVDWQAIRAGETKSSEGENNAVGSEGK